MYGCMLMYASFPILHYLPLMNGVEYYYKLYYFVCVWLVGDFFLEIFVSSLFWLSELGFEN